MGKVNLTKRITVDGRQKFCPLVYLPSGRIKPGMVRLDGKEVKHDGVFYLDYYIAGKRQRSAVGGDEAAALAAKERKELELKAIAAGLDVNGTVLSDTGRRTLAAAAAEYLQEIKDHKSHKTFLAYSKTLEYFQESCTKTFVDQIDRKDLMKFSRFLADEKAQSDRSVCNKFENIMGFLKYCGVSAKDIGLGKEDRPDYDEETPEIYTTEELNKFFAACTPEEAMWFHFFEYTGMREGEVIHCQWSWIDMENRTITVQPNKRFNWRPKKNKTRQIPISNKLYALLKDWKRKSDSTCDLVFPTSGCNRKLDFLDCLKRVAKRAGLFCGKCDGCRQETPNCGRWFLHKFRATFATRALRKTDLETMRTWLGHADMASSLRYLRPAEGTEAQAKINAVFD
jgi:integrase